MFLGLLLVVCLVNAAQEIPLAGGGLPLAVSRPRSLGNGQCFFVVTTSFLYALFSDDTFAVRAPVDNMVPVPGLTASAVAFFDDPRNAGVTWFAVGDSGGNVGFSSVSNCSVAPAFDADLTVTFGNTSFLFATAVQDSTDVWFVALDKAVRVGWVSGANGVQLGIRSSVVVSPPLNGKYTAGAATAADAKNVFCEDGASTGRVFGDGIVSNPFDSVMFRGNSFSMASFDMSKPIFGQTWGSSIMSGVTDGPGASGFVVQFSALQPKNYDALYLSDGGIVRFGALPGRVKAGEHMLVPVALNDGSVVRMQFLQIFDENGGGQFPTPNLTFVSPLFCEVVPNRQSPTFPVFYESYLQSFTTGMPVYTVLLADQSTSVLVKFSAHWKDQCSNGQVLSFAGGGQCDVTGRNSCTCSIVFGAKPQIGCVIEKSTGRRRIKMV